MSKGGAGLRVDPCGDAFLQFAEVAARLAHLADCFFHYISRYDGLAYSCNAAQLGLQYRSDLRILIWHEQYSLNLLLLESYSGLAAQLILIADEY